MMVWFDGMDFTGPIDVSALPSEAGVYLVCTDASGGVKILGAYESDNMASSAASNPKKQCWNKHKVDSDPVAYYLAEKNPSKRSDIVRGIADRRYYKLDCYDPPTDDF